MHHRSPFREEIGVARDSPASAVRPALPSLGFQVLEVRELRDFSHEIGAECVLELPHEPSNLSVPFPDLLRQHSTFLFCQNPLSSETFLRTPSLAAWSSRLTTVRWHRKKFSTPPHSGLLAYWVLLKLFHDQPLRLVANREPLTSTVFGYRQSPKFASSQPSPGDVRRR